MVFRRKLKSGALMVAALMRLDNQGMHIVAGLVVGIKLAALLTHLSVDCRCELI